MKSKWDMEVLDFHLVRIKFSMSSGWQQLSQELNDAFEFTKYFRD